MQCMFHSEPICVFGVTQIKKLGKIYAKKQTLWGISAISASPTQPVFAFLSSAPLSGRLFSVTTDLGWRTLLSTAHSGHSIQLPRGAEHLCFPLPLHQSHPQHLSAILLRKGPKTPENYADTVFSSRKLIYLTSDKLLLRKKEFL